MTTDATPRPPVTHEIHLTEVQSALLRAVEDLNAERMQSVIALRQRAAELEAEAQSIELELDQRYRIELNRVAQEHGEELIPDGARVFVDDGLYRISWEGHPALEADPGAVPYCANAGVVREGGADGEVSVVIGEGQEP